jgi:hypothetical protein
MAVSTRTSAPSYKIFEPDALDTTYAKGVISDPVMGGIAGAMGLAHDMSKMRNQDNYLASQEKFNKMAGNLDAMEIAQKQKAEILKAATTLLGHGAPTTSLEPGALSGLYNQQGYLDDTLGKSLRDLNAAKAEGARSGGGGSEGKDYYTVQSPVILPDGTVGTETVRTQGKPPPRTSTGGAANVVKQNIIKAVGAALGPDAKGVDTQNGGTKWTSPSKPGVVIEFDAQGNAKR